MKQHLVENYPNDVLYYDAEWDNEKKIICGLESFSNALVERLKAQFMNDLPNDTLTPEAEQMNYDTTFIQEQVGVFSGRTYYLDDLSEFMFSNDTIITMRGYSGIGKSCLLAKFAQNLNENGDVFSVALFLGNGKYLTTPVEILRSLIYRIELFLGCIAKKLSSLSVEELKNYAINVIREVCKIKPLVIIIDNLDILSHDDRARIFTFLPLPNEEIPGYKMIFTATDKLELPEKMLYGKQHTTFKIEGVGENAIVEIINKILSENGKELSNEASKRFSKVALFRSPFYILNSAEI